MAQMRLFVAVWPDEPACADLRLVHRKDQPGVRFVPEENWHVTLRFLGNAHPSTVAEALGAVRVAPAAVTLGPAIELLSDHSVIVRADGLAAWAAAVNRATQELGDSPVRRRFVGHITLARLGPSVRRGKARPPAILGAPFHSSSLADEFTLVASHLGPRGARYEVLERWPAGGPERAGS